ncbi:hypothetical protein [Microbacterium gorillae]|uniref:hypothetical protein n=1 Tax=Microbacterium gorillae TaxID=1231063 RepID=UPI0006941217|nr:hypothetical protein [Microbacterium gorillae]
MQLVTDDDPSRFVQIWESAGTGEWVIREGTLGRTGRLTETGRTPAEVSVAELAAPFLARGFREFPDDGYTAHVVVQFPTENAAYDRRLIAHATEWLDSVLDERGLGYVDGFDRGKRLSDRVKIVVNIFAFVKDGELGAVAAHAALKQGSADVNRAAIAWRDNSNDEWTVRYDRISRKLPGLFSL